MKSTHRIYSIPYNGTDPAWFLREVEKRKKNIDHVYCELPFNESEMLSHVRFIFDGPDGERMNLASASQKRAQYIRNCFEFLRISKGKVRRICPVNAMYYKFNSDDELKNFAINLARLANRYQLEGLIISDYQVAVLVHALVPDLELQTSCNGYQWTLRQMEIWREKCGIKMFNPPREILRAPSKLKEMHDAGYKLKCLVNEGCLMGCPNSFRHNLSVSLHCYAGMLSCCQSGAGDILRGNWILPRWQKYYDEYVDVYKIAGRNTPGDYPFKCMDSYLAENNDMALSDLMISGTVQFAKHMLPEDILKRITLDKVPDKLLTCECKECDRCNLCNKIVGSLIPKEYWDRFTFKVKVVNDTDE